jgi:methylmalonyl-CoA/ethylmalonyl-CoA epimerase
VKPAHLDHIGISISPNSRLAELLQILGLPKTGSEEVEGERVRVEWVPLPKVETKVELLTGTAPDSAISKFLAKTGKDVIHHLSFRVADIKSAMSNLDAAGFKLVYPEPREGAGECLVNFIHPSTTGGLLIEITEKK